MCDQTSNQYLCLSGALAYPPNQHHPVIVCAHIALYEAEPPAGALPTLEVARLDRERGVALPVALGAPLRRPFAFEAEALHAGAKEQPRRGPARDLFLNGRADLMPESRYYREVFVSVPIADVLVEGFIVLLFEAEDGLVVVDYKTDRVESVEQREASDRYAAQVGAYALAVQESLGRRVSEVVLVFLHAKREGSYKNIESLLTHVRRRAELAIAAL